MRVNNRIRLVFPTWKWHRELPLTQLFFYWMVTVKLKLRQCVITLLYKTFTALSNELPLNNMQRASHPRGSLSFSSLNVQNYYLIVTLFLPCCLSFSPPLLLLLLLLLSLHSLLLPSLDRLSHLCWPSAFLLLGCLLLDVSGGCATLSHAGGGLWERVLPQKVLLSVRILLPRAGGGHLCGHRLQELWDQESVRVKTGLLHLQIEK